MNGNNFIKNHSLITELEIEMDRRNSAIPLKDLKTQMLVLSQVRLFVSKLSLKMVLWL